jgi:glucose 1-dehydrogenase
VNDLQTLIDSAVKSFGRLDIIINNAGVETRTSVLDTTEEQYEGSWRSISRARSSARS